MTTDQYTYQAIFSSDWNQCLAPCGPFDVMAFHYPELTPVFDRIFKQYTGNVISLGEAIRLLDQSLPTPITQDQMDTYLEKSFQMYKGIGDLIRWCSEQDVLFMVNTTGMIGYFQRAFAKGLLPMMPALSANPAIRFPAQGRQPRYIFPLNETEDKGANTEKAIEMLNVNPQKIIIMGDSGGDGPHFSWGGQHEAFMIGSMAKTSLSRYCQDHALSIDHYFGIRYDEGEPMAPHQEMQVDFKDLVTVIDAYLCS
jgi:2-hydroxy-3-keto-5-methylthiopentenyl-1-phosphate phosphatase